MTVSKTMKNISGGQVWSLALLVDNKETETEDLGVRGLALILPHFAGGSMHRKISRVRTNLVERASYSSAQ